MIKIGKNGYFLRCYSYGKYNIDKIHFYNENGIIISSKYGWLENDGQDLDNIILDIDNIPLKRKEDFSIKGAFIKSNGESYGGDLTADLYINADIVDLHFLEYKKEFGYMIVEYYVGKDIGNNEFRIENVVKILDKNKRKYQQEIERVGKAIWDNINYLNKKDYEAYIRDLVEYGKQYYEEIKKIEDYTIEDYLKETESEGK